VRERQLFADVAHPFIFWLHLVVSMKPAVEERRADVLVHVLHPGEPDRGAGFE